MKKYINHNYFWSSLFVEQLVQLGVKHACVSPGSRNTSLTFALASNKKIKKYIHIDERSGAFFALGIAKKTNGPVALFTTSGTAVVELYPAIVEAYQQRIPLIVCTADRPYFLKNVGANQTINQDNIFSNHIRYFADLGLPLIRENKLNRFTEIIRKGLCVSTMRNKGPVHFNLQFEKPFEPNAFTQEINFSINEFVNKKSCSTNLTSISKRDLNSLKKTIQNSKKGIITIGWGNFSEKFYKELISFSKKYNFPVLPDGTSRLRYGGSIKQNIISNHTAFIKEYVNEIDLVIQFGNAPTSQFMLNFMNKTKAPKILINKFGDLKDPSRKKGKIIKIDEVDFLKYFKEKLVPNNLRKDWTKEIKRVDLRCELIKNKLFNNSFYGSEPRLAKEILRLIPDKSNLFISNSMAVRDYDYFAASNKNIKVFTNRGASGIDGIISTASGIASQSKQPTFLVIGDLAFYHNLSALSTIKDYLIPLKIILINNNGGGIFNMLAVAEENEHFEKYWRTPQNLDFAKIVKSFGIKHYQPKSWKSFRSAIIPSIKNNTQVVIEGKTDSKKSLTLRRQYWSKVKEEFPPVI